MMGSPSGQQLLDFLWENNLGCYYEEIMEIEIALAILVITAAHSNKSNKVFKKIVPQEHIYYIHCYLVQSYICCP